MRVSIASITRRELAMVDLPQAAGRQDGNSIADGKRPPRFQEPSVVNLSETLAQPCRGRRPRFLNLDVFCEGTTLTSATAPPSAWSASAGARACQRLDFITSTPQRSGSDRRRQEEAQDAAHQAAPKDRGPPAQPCWST